MTPGCAVSLPGRRRPRPQSTRLPSRPGTHCRVAPSRIKRAHCHNCQRPKAVPVLRMLHNLRQVAPLGLHLLSRLLMVPQCDTNARVSATQFTSPSHAHASINGSATLPHLRPTPHAVLTSNPHHHTGEKCWSLKCREADTEEVERANAALPEPPAAIMLEGAALPGGLAAGFAGLYTRGTEVTGKPPTKQFREVNGGIDRRRVSNTVDEPHAPHSCVPVHACSHACSIDHRTRR